ncbi:FecR family protein [Neptuniibacter sp.]|uniref:FecR family protein n=1 Tax=Neptuniibacter sp. TaxID=1962643 RepID=UPI00262884F8|nr:FecR family protein [Neptuniibacter sp.]MCP4595303.1 FecR domain-containing protein [Neptuniibacter sp.]
MLSLFKSPLRVLCLMLLFPSLSFADAIGKVVLVKGSPLVVREQQHLFIKRNDKLFQNDTVITPVGSRILIKFNDKTTLSLAENTEFELSKYEFGKTKSDVSFKMLKGAFRTLTGKIGKQENPKFEIHTPIATIGVRGTEFWGGMIFSDALDVTMLSGKGVYVENELGRVELTEATDGTMVKPGMAPSTVKKWSQDKLIKAAAATEVKKKAQGSSSFDY